MRYFTDRVVQHPGRVKMTPVSGQTNVYDVERQEGTVTTPGTPFNAETFNGIINSAHSFGTCTTGENVADKIVTCDGFVRYTGACISVRFNNANTSTAATMNVNGTGAKPIRALMNDTAAPVGLWKAGEVVTLVYGGTTWLVVDGGRGLVDQKRVFYGTSSTGASTSAKTATVDSSFVLQAGAIVAIKFSNAAMSNPGDTRTLNVNSTGAKSIIVEGNTTFKYVPWGAGDVGVFVYDGTNWIMTNPSHQKRVFYGTSSTGASTSAKTATVDSSFVLQAGATVAIKFSNAAMSNPGSTRTLNVNSTGAKSIIVEGNTTLKYIPWGAGDVGVFVYDGTNWIMTNPSQRPSNPTISISTSTGTLSSYSIRQSGNIVQLVLAVTNSSGVAAGSNIYTGKINTPALLPVVAPSGAGFIGQRAIAGNINREGDIIIRNSTPSAVTLSANVYVGFTYIV